jgi:hypothetical protein
MHLERCARDPVVPDFGVVASRVHQFSARDSSDDEEEEEEEEEEEDDDDDDDDDSEEESDSDDEPPDCKRFLSDVMEELKSQGVDTQALWQVFIFFAPLPSPLLSPCSCDQTSRWSEGRCAGE